MAVNRFAPIPRRARRSSTLRARSPVLAVAHCLRAGPHTQQDVYPERCKYIEQLCGRNRLGMRFDERVPSLLDPQARGELYLGQAAMLAQRFEVLRQLRRRLQE